MEAYQSGFLVSPEGHVATAWSYVLDVEPVVLLDEPFSGVDPLTRADIHARFQELSGRAVSSAVLVTHDMAEAVALASYLVVLQEGQVAQAGRSDLVLAQPANDYVAQLMASARV